MHLNFYDEQGTKLALNLVLLPLKLMPSTYELNLE